MDNDFQANEILRLCRCNAVLDLTLLHDSDLSDEVWNKIQEEILSNKYPKLTRIYMKHLPSQVYPEIKSMIQIQ